MSVTHLRFLALTGCLTLVVGLGTVGAAAGVTSTPSTAASTTSTVDGQLVKITSEGGSAPADRTVIRTSTGNLAVAADIAGTAATGATVRAELTNGVVTAVQTLAAPPAATGTHQIVVVPVYDPTQSAPADATSAIAAAVSATDAYYDAATGGAIRLTVKKTYGWTKVDGVTACNTAAIEAAVRAKTKTDVTGSLTNVLVYAPSSASCSFIGQAYQPGNYLLLHNDLSTGLVVQEFGHNLGLGHADTTTCTNGGDTVPISATCTLGRSADPYDPMGSGSLGLLSAPHLAQLGVIPPADIAENYETATTHLEPLDSASGTREIVVHVDGRTYSLEYRTRTGLDAGAAPDPSGGVLVRVQDPFLRDADGDALAGDIGLINFRSGPSSTGYELPSGESWSDLSNHWSISVGTADASGVNVTVTRHSDITKPDPFAITVPTSGHVIGGVATSMLVAWSPAVDGDTGIMSLDVILDGVIVKHIDADSDLVPTSTILTPMPNAGSHSIVVQSADRVGNVRSTPARSFSYDPNYDPPLFTKKPRAYVRTGTVTATQVPVEVRWAASTVTGVCAETISGTTLTTRNAPKRVKGAAYSRYATVQDVGRSTLWTVVTTSCEGVTRSSTGITGTATIDPVSKRTKGFHGSWTRTKAHSLLGGSEYTSRKKNASASFSVTGRAFGIVASRSSKRGSIAVYVDGKRVAGVSLHASRTEHSLVVWTTSFGDSGRHTIKIVNEATKHRPTVGIDGIVRLS